MKHLRCVTIAMTTHVHKRFHVQPLQQWNRVRHADQIRKVKLNVLAPVFERYIEVGACVCNYFRNKLGYSFPIVELILILISIFLC